MYLSALKGEPNLNSCARARARAIRLFAPPQIKAHSRRAARGRAPIRNQRMCIWRCWECEWTRHMASGRPSNFIYSEVWRGRVGGARARAPRVHLKSDPLNFLDHEVIYNTRAHIAVESTSKWHYSVVSSARLESARWRTFFFLFSFFWAFGGARPAGAGAWQIRRYCCI